MDSAPPLPAPFPWFGGKSRAASLIWERLGDVPNYVEPFFGSGAVMLGRPTPPQIETINDRDGFVANFWRAVRSDPGAVAHYADSPVFESDLHARHAWLTAQRASLTARLEGDPAYYDAKIAGWWVWGLSCWIGGEWCAGVGPWVVRDGLLVRAAEGGDGTGISRQIPYLRRQGNGVYKASLREGADGTGIIRKRPHLRPPMGVHKASLREGEGHRQSLITWMEALAERLRFVRVCCGDWTRVLGATPTTLLGLTAVVLDPPYAQTERHASLYAVETDVSQAVREWALEHGDDLLLRIALCGYEGEHEMPGSWECVSWTAGSGYTSMGNGAGAANRFRERIWFSPGCARPEAEPRQIALFG